MVLTIRIETDTKFLNHDLKILQKKIYLFDKVMFD